MAIFNEAQNNDIVKTKLDSVLFQIFNQDAQPGLATARTSSIFRQQQFDKAVYQEDIYSGLPVTPVVPELGIVPQNAPTVTNYFTTTIKKFAQTVPISKEMYEDVMHGVWPKTIQEAALKSRIAQDQNAMNLFNDGFTTYLTADGSALFGTHTLIGGGTQVNFASGGGSALSSTSINNSAMAIQTMKDQTGTVIGATPKWILVPPALFDTAIRLTQSVLVGDSSTNGVNIWRGIYGLEVYQSPYLSAAAGGSDTAWFMGSDYNALTRLIRTGMQTELVDWKYSDNLAYKYICTYREAVKCADYYGLYGNVGA